MSEQTSVGYGNPGGWAPAGPVPAGPPGWAPPPPPRPAVRLPRVIAGVTMLLGAGLGIAGSFLKLVSEKQSNEGQLLFETTVTTWGTTPHWKGDEPHANIVGHSVLLGIPLTVAAALALVAGALLLVTARRDVLGPRLLALAAGGALAGVASTAVLLAESHLSYAETVDSFTVAPALGIGMWLLLAAGVVTLVGVVSAALPVRQRPVTGPPAGGPLVYQVGPGQPDLDAPTPPYGFPAPTAPPAQQLPTQ